MINIDRIHPAQTIILYALSRATRARYSELMRPTKLEGDRFKYHVNKLVERNLIYKASDGLYELTAEGKEFANRLSEQTGREIEQPKSSMLLVVTSKVDDITYYLAHKRDREPFREYWGIMSAPLLRGMPVRDSAAKEFKKQTGLSASFSPIGFYRVIDQTPSGKVLEDKLFSLLFGTIEGTPTPQYWYGGTSAWLTRAELLAKEKLFPITAKTLEMAEQSIWFSEDICTYTLDEY